MENRNLENTRLTFKNKYGQKIDYLRKVFFMYAKKMEERRNTPNIQPGFSEDKLQSLKQKYITLSKFAEALRNENNFTLEIAKAIEMLVPRYFQSVPKKLVRRRD